MVRVSTPKIFMVRVFTASKKFHFLFLRPLHHLASIQRKQLPKTVTHTSLFTHWASKTSNFSLFNSSPPKTVNASSHYTPSNPLCPRSPCQVMLLLPPTHHPMKILTCNWQRLKVLINQGSPYSERTSSFQQKSC